jgi:hypothetical protein
MIVGASSAWADTTGQIKFGSASGSTNVNAASKTGDDSQGNTWTITTVGTESFTPNTSYAQIGSSSKPATSITFTTTLSEDVNIKSFSAKFGGFSGTAGTVTLKVDNTSVGSGSLNTTNDVTVSNSSTKVGKVLTVTVTGISKGVKAYEINYTYAPATVDLTDDEFSWSASSYTATIGASNSFPSLTNTESVSVTYQSTDTDVATIASDGTISLMAAGETTIKAVFAGNSTYNAKTVSYDLTVVDNSKVSTPTISVAAGTYNTAQSVELDCATEDATIYYTTNGDDPTKSSTAYSSAITVDQSMTIKAKAFKDGISDSEIASATYTLQCVAPTFDPVAGTVAYNTPIALSAATGTTIYYTTNGDTPTTSSTEYDSSSKPVIEASKTIKAITTKTGWTNSDVSSAAYTANYTITGASNDEDMGTVTASTTTTSNTTITATPKSGYRVKAGDGGYTVTSGTATVVNNGDNTFTVTPTTNCTVQVNFEAIPTHTVTFSVNGNTSRTATVAEGSNITFPTAVETTPGDGEFPKVINGQTFQGWYTGEYSNATTAPTYVNTASVTMGASNVTYYAVYADVDISEGSYTLDYDESNGTSAVSDLTLGYGNAVNYTAKDGGAWIIKAYKSSGMQINTGKNSSIKMPSCAGNIQSVKITCSVAKAVGVSSSDYSGSGTISYLASGTDATSQTIDLSASSISTGYIVPKSGSTAITKIVIDYANVEKTNFTTDNRASAGIAFANASVDVKLTSGYTGQALTNTNSVSPITYSSSDETVATINSSTGAITELLKAGTTTITATFAGNATYKPAEVSYDLNVTEKTPHGLAYATDAVEKLTTDAAFTNTLTNAHSLTVSYSSSATGVATVNSSTGEVTIKGAGSTTITATFAGDEDYEAGNASYTLTVSKATPTLAFASANITGHIGETVSANALTNPANLTVSYSSSDETVATVNSTSGVVANPLKAGTTTITASFAGNDTYVAGNASYTLKVLTNPTITVSDEEIAYGETFTVDDSAITGGAITVTSGNDKIATVAGLVITPVSCGTVTITVSTAEDENYRDGQATFDLTITAPAGSTTAPSSEVTYTFDFTDNTDWGFPTNYQTGENSYTKDGKTVTLNTPDDTNGYKFNTNVLLIGKSDATLTLPAFDKPVTKISTTGKTGASSKVTQNIFVGSTAVSTSTTDATKDHEYIISSSYQEAGTIYTLKVTNANNTQIPTLTVHMYQAPTATVTLNKYGYATYCSVNPIDFSSTTGYTAWRVNNIASDGTITFKKVTEKIKGGQGVLLYNKNADGVNTSIATITFADGSTVFDDGSDANNENDNLMLGTTAPTYVTTVKGDYTNFGLKGNELLPINMGVIPTGKAYLPVPTSIAESLSADARLTFVFEDDETTGISTMNNVQCTMNNEVYNLKGQRVEKPVKGQLYIVNGKKVVIK